METEDNYEWLPLSALPRLYAELHPHGTHEEACDVLCKECEWHVTAPNFYSAQQLAIQHDRQRHWESPCRAAS